ncbi:hypothetical protein SAXI111661_17750 [Saccharomonospora xinjiangensis]|nr:hypothetical protein EYD13_09970 [Saccharomonospora xinjiangensis]
MASELADLYPGERLLWTGMPTRYPVLSERTESSSRSVPSP